jgi:hypothetical protein
MNLNRSDIDVFLIESCPAVVQALLVLSLKLTSSAYHTHYLHTYITYTFS